MVKTNKLSLAVCTAIAGASCLIPSVTMASPVTAVASAAVGTASNVILHDVTVEPRLFSPNFDVKAHSDSIDYNGGDVSLKDDLDFSADNAPELVLRYHNLSVDLIHSKSDGSTNLSGNFTVDNKKFVGGSKIHADSKLNYINLKVTNPLVSVPSVKTTWNYGLSVINWKMSANGTASVTSGNTTMTQSASASESYTIPIPMVGVGAEASLGGGVSAYANISGLPLASYGHIYDLETGLKYSPVPAFSLNAGYRRIDINVHHGNDRGSFVLDGPWVGLAYTF